MPGTLSPEAFMQKFISVSVLSLLALSSTALAADPAPSATTAGDAKWMPANPDKPGGPHMAVISGTPKEGAFTALGKFPAGMATPLHSHSANFTGVVISGTVQSGRSPDDHATLTAGTTWTEPKGEVHFTGCTKDAECIIAFHMSGAMSMVPAKTATEGEMKGGSTAPDKRTWKPINPKKSEGPQMMVLSGDMAKGPFQALVSLPGGSSSPEHSHSSTYSAAVLSGGVTHGGPDALSAGSFWTEKGGHPHVTGCSSDEACVFFACMDGPFDMKPVAAPTPAPAAPAEEAK
jgi:quercetin dioxygenase-like cupin family protein